MTATSSQTSAIFEQLPGSWTQTRTMTPGGRYEGTAVFTRIDDETLHYCETGKLILDSGHVSEDASRRYIFKRVGDRIEVHFDEAPPRLFHELIFDQNGRAEATHDCRDDFYRSTYHFTSDTSFTITHDVRGPRKGYVMETKYVRN